MDASPVRLVWQRAENRCEYCQLSQAFDDRTFEIDHIISEKHHGPTIAGNLAPSCFRCNSFKDSDISKRDQKTRELTPLFNPRRHRWAKHFRWRSAARRSAAPPSPSSASTIRFASNSAQN